MTKSNDIEQLKELWKICFGDSDEYVNFFFEKYYRPEYSINLEKGSVVASALFVPYEMIRNGKLIPHIYILGVCTHPEYRRQGLSNKIIRHGMYEQYKKGFEIASLIPQSEYLFRIYEKLGFASMFDICLQTLSWGDFLNLPSFRASLYNKIDFNNLYNLYTEWYKLMDVAVLKSIEHFRFILDEIAMSGAKIFMLKNKGMAVAQKESGGYIIKEILFFDECSHYSLLYEIFNYYKCKQLTVIYPKPLLRYVQAKPIGMARVINPYPLFKRLAVEKRSLNISFKLNDSVIQANTGIYTISHGNVKFLKQGDFDYELDIAEFTNLILGYNIPKRFSPVFDSLNSYTNLLFN